MHISFGDENGVVPLQSSLEIRTMFETKMELKDIWFVLEFIVDITCNNHKVTLVEISLDNEKTTVECPFEMKIAEFANDNLQNSSISTSRTVEIKVPTSHINHVLGSLASSAAVVLFNNVGLFTISLFGRNTLRPNEKGELLVQEKVITEVSHLEGQLFRNIQNHFGKQLHS